MHFRFSKSLKGLLTAQEANAIPLCNQQQQQCARQKSGSHAYGTHSGAAWLSFFLNEQFKYRPAPGAWQSRKSAYSDITFWRNATALAFLASLSPQNNAG